MVEDTKNISAQNAKIFTDALKNEEMRMTLFNYDGWLGKYEQVLGGIETQADTIRFNRDRLQKTVQELMNEAENNALDESDPGYNIALKLNAIMPMFCDELELKYVASNLQNLMLLAASNVIGTMKGMGIAENVVKEQKEFLNEHWERMERLLSDNIQKLVTNSEENMKIILKHNREVVDKLIQQNEKNNAQIKSQLVPTYIPSPPVQKVMDRDEVNPEIEQANKKTQELLDKLNAANDKMEKIRLEQEQNKVERAVINTNELTGQLNPEQKQTEIKKIKQVVIGMDNHNIDTDTKEKNGNGMEEKDMKISEKERNSMQVPFSNVDSHSDMGLPDSSREGKIGKVLVDAENAFKKIPTIRGLKISYSKKCKVTPDGEPRNKLDAMYEKRLSQLEQVNALATKIDNNIPP